MKKNRPRPIDLLLRTTTRVVLCTSVERSARRGAETMSESLSFEQRILADAEEAASKVAGGFVAVSHDHHGFRVTATSAQLSRIVGKLGFANYSPRMWHAKDEGNGVQSIVLAKYKMHALIACAAKAVA